MSEDDTLFLWHKIKLKYKKSMCVIFTHFKLEWSKVWNICFLSKKNCPTQISYKVSLLFIFLLGFAPVEFYYLNHNWVTLDHLWAVDGNHHIIFNGVLLQVSHFSAVALKDGYPGLSHWLYRHEDQLQRHEDQLQSMLSKPRKTSLSGSKRIPKICI